MTTENKNLREKLEAGKDILRRTMERLPLPQQVRLAPVLFDDEQFAQNMSNGEKINGEDLWQDKEIRFDVDHRMLRLITGEFQIDKMDNVEDTKGNNGDKGVMRITNLRVIWHAANMPRINLSIGYLNITGLAGKEAMSRVRGMSCDALYIMAKSAGTVSKFEFIFTAHSGGHHSKLFNTIASVHRAYDTTRLYRELRMRGPFIDDNNQLKLLPLESMVERIPGVWNLSTDQGNLGVLLITTCRVVWYAALNLHYNVSIPYLQLFSSRIRESKFGLALVLETTSKSGEYVLGFRIDPEDQLHHACRNIQAMHKAFNQKPIFGVTYVKDRPPSPRVGDSDGIDHLEDDVEVEQKQLRTDAYAAYFTDGQLNGEERRPAVYSDELGMAIEQLKTGFSVSDLWNVYTD